MSTDRLRPSVRDFAIILLHGRNSFLLPDSRPGLFILFLVERLDGWTWCFSKFLPLIPCEHFITSRASVPHLHSQSSWNTSYVISWNSGCFKIVISLSVQLEYQLCPAGIRLLKGELEVRKTYPRGVPPGPSPGATPEAEGSGRKEKEGRC